MARQIVVGNNFQEGLDIMRVKICQLKGGNKWENSRRLDSNGLDIGGLKTTN